MVYFFHTSISLCNSSVDQQPPSMAASALADSGLKSRNRKAHSSPSNSLQVPLCDRSRSAVVDVVILVAVVAAVGFLFYPYIQLLITKSIEFGGVILCLVKEEIEVAPWIYFSLGVSVTCAVLATWGVVACTTRKCGNPNCKGLRKAEEFDIQLETEDRVKKYLPSLGNKDNSNNGAGGGVKKGLFKLPCDHHRELEAELKKMAPPNGRAILVLRGKCGCPVGRLEVPGPKKNQKFKK